MARRISTAARNAFRSRLGRGIATSYAAQGLGLFITFLGGVIAARLLGPSDRGVLAFITQLAALSVAIASAGISQAITVIIVNARDQDETGPALWASSRLTKYCSILAAVVGAALVIVLVRHSTVLTVSVGAISLAGMGAFRIIMMRNWGVLRSRGDFLIVNCSTILVAVVYTLGLLVLALLHVRNPGVASLALTAGTACGMFLTYRFARRETYARTPDVFAASRRWFTAMTRFGARSYVGGVLGLDSLSIEVLVLGATGHSYILGIYSVALALGAVVRSQSPAANLILLPLAAAKGTNPRTLTKALIAILVFGAVTTAILFPLGRLAIPRIYGQRFEVSALVLALVLVSAFLAMSRQALGEMLRGKGWPGFVSIQEAIIVTLATPVYFAVVDQGLAAVALTTLLAQLLGIGILASRVKRSLANQSQDDSSAGAPTAIDAEGEGGARATVDQRAIPTARRDWRSAGRRRVR